jgi:hypothetical protein
MSNEHSKSIPIPNRTEINVLLYFDCLDPFLFTQHTLSRQTLARMSYNPYAPPQQSYPPQQQHPLPPNPNPSYNQYPQPQAVSNNYDRPPMNPPVPSTGYGQGPPPGYGNSSLPPPPPPLYGERRDDRAGAGGPPGRYSGGGRDMSPGE